MFDDEGRLMCAQAIAVTFQCIAQHRRDIAGGTAALTQQRQAAARAVEQRGSESRQRRGRSEGQIAAAADGAQAGSRTAHNVRVAVSWLLY